MNGLEHLDGSRAALIVGYHGRPFAYDMCMLTVAIYDRLGYLPHGVVHRGMKHIPILRWLVDGLGFVTGDDDDVRRAVAHGEHIVVTPGGAREGCRGLRSRYRVDWGAGSAICGSRSATGCPSCRWRRREPTAPTSG